MTRKTWKQYREGCLTKETFNLDDPLLKVKYCKYCGKRLPLFSGNFLYCNNLCRNRAYAETKRERQLEEAYRKAYL